MHSIRTSLVAVMPICAVAALLCSEIRKSAIDTTDWRDVTVNGRGYIHTVNAQGEQSIWFRSVHLELNISGELCVNWAGELRRIEPRIVVPTDWRKIEILKDGSVTINDSESSVVLIGSINLTNFLGDVTKELVTQQDVDNGLGSPFECAAGTQGTGDLIQFTEISYTLPLSSQVVVAISLTVAYAMICVIWGAKRYRNELEV